MHPFSLPGSPALGRSPSSYSRIFLISVAREIPSSRAARVRFAPCARSVRSMCARSTSASVRETCGVRSSSPAPRTSAGRCCGSTPALPRASSSARSSTLRSSRTLPGHGYEPISSSASALTSPGASGHPAAKLGDERAHRLAHVLARPRAQRRQIERHHAEPVVEVLAEALLRHLGREVARRRRDDAHVHRAPRACRPSGAPGATRARASSFGCSVAGSSAISSRKSVPPSAASNRPGTGPPTPRSTPNSSSVERLHRPHRAVDLVEGAAAARAQRVDRARHAPLPHPALADEQRHRALAAREQLDLLRRARASAATSRAASRSRCARGARRRRDRARAAAPSRARGRRRRRGAPSSTGFVRKLSAPICIAFTASATSPCPVIMMTTGRCSRVRSSTSNPVMSGSSRSSSTSAGCSASTTATASSPVAGAQHVVPRPLENSGRRRT